MACSSHAAESERLISIACSDPEVPYGDLQNPFVTLRGLADEMAYRMEQADCAIAGYNMTIDRGNGLLAVRDDAGFVVGGIFHKSILVLPKHRGLGLGAEILIQAFETGVMHPETMNKDNLLTAAGRANRRAAHRIAVERAVRAGVEVEPEVLADYHHLSEEWGAAAINLSHA